MLDAAVDTLFDQFAEHASAVFAALHGPHCLGTQVWPVFTGAPQPQCTAGACVRCVQARVMPTKESLCRLLRNETFHTR